MPGRSPKHMKLAPLADRGVAAHANQRHVDAESDRVTRSNIDKPSPKKLPMRTLENKLGSTPHRPLALGPAVKSEPAGKHGNNMQVEAGRSLMHPPVLPGERLASLAAEFGSKSQDLSESLGIAPHRAHGQGKSNVRPQPQALQDHHHHGLPLAQHTQDSQCSTMASPIGPLQSAPGSEHASMPPVSQYASLPQHDGKLQYTPTAMQTNGDGTNQWMGSCRNFSCQISSAEATGLIELLKLDLGLLKAQNERWEFIAREWKVRYVMAEKEAKSNAAAWQERCEKLERDIGEWERLFDEDYAQRMAKQRIALSQGTKREREQSSDESEGHGQTPDAL